MSTADARGVYWNFTHACQTCGGTVHVVDGQEKPHACAPDKPTTLPAIVWPDLPAPGPLDAVAPHLAVYVVVYDGKLLLFGFDRERAHEVARDTGGVVTRLPVVGDYRTTRGEAT